MSSFRILEGDCLSVLRDLDAGSVQTCVTSPPYWGLRDYGSEGQLGLEPTPEQYVENMVAVFREVRRVLRDDGTLWLNLGDSYAGYWGDKTAKREGRRSSADTNGWTNDFNMNAKPDFHTAFDASGVKPKDLVGIPWAVAEALRDPYYSGRIRDERDRVWLAAMIDAEGCIFIHRRKAGQHNGQGYHRKADSFGSGLEVSNTNRRVVERCLEIAQAGSICEQTAGRKQTLYRWNLRTNECREILREVYPYLVAKQHEARLACGVPSSGKDATAAWEALKIVHGGGLTDVDFKPPASMFEQGYYLRSDIVWNKLNPMPESVTDRPTKAHEYLFLLTKQPRYFYDADAIREAANYDGPNGAQQSPYAQGFGRRTPEQEAERRIKNRTVCPGIDTNGGGQGNGAMSYPAHSRNKRSVWTVTTQPFPGAHFATFPPKLIEPCILAGSSRGDLVLDPFNGAGTTGVVALRHDRDYIGIELNPEYAQMARDRIYDDAPLLNVEAA